MTTQALSLKENLCKSPNIKGVTRRIAVASPAVFGIGSLFAWIQLYDGFLVPNTAMSYNYSIYIAIAQLLTFACIGFISRKRVQDTNKDRAIIFAGIVGVIGAILSPIPTAIELASVLTYAAIGVSQAFLTITWFCDASFRAQKPFLKVLTSFLLGMALLTVCHLVNKNSFAILSVMLPAISCMTFFIKRRFETALNASHLMMDRIRADMDRPRTVREFLTMPLGISLSLTAAATQAGSLFVSIAANPYLLQSESITQCWLAASTILFGMLYITSRLFKDSLRMFIAITMGLLFVGLFCLQIGILGSIVIPFGLIMAGRTGCIAIGWFILIAISQEDYPGSLSFISFGALAINGSFGWTIGLLANNILGISFSSLTIGASIAMLVFFCTFMLLGSHRIQRPNSENTQTQTARQAQKDIRSEYFARIELTQKEIAVAEGVLQGLTYEQIAETTHVTTRTVKYHTNHIFQKAMVESRSEFEQLFHS